MSVDFNGTDEYISCGSDASIDNVFDGGGGISFWFYFDTDKANNIICAAKGDAHENENTGWLIYASVADDNIYFEHGFDTLRGAWNSNASTLTDNTWHHIAVLYDKGATANDPTIYIDGVSVNINEGTTPNGTVANDSGANLVIAAATYDTTSYYGDTEIEDARIYGDDTMAAEEASLLAAGYRGVLGGEVLWLSMNEATGAAGAWEGTSLANGTNLLPDLSVNNNNGDPVNTPTGRASKAPRYGVAV